MSRKKKWLIGVAAVVALVMGAGLYQARRQEAEARAIEQLGAPLISALERHRKEKGGYPKDLAPLVPAYVAAVPVCPRMSRPMPYALEQEGKAFEIYCPAGWLQKYGYRSAAGKWELYE